MSEAQLSRGALDFLKLLRWYESRHIPFPGQKKLAVHRKVGERQIRRYLAELVHVGLVEVHQNGDGRAASYTLNVRADVRADVRAEIEVAIPQDTPNAQVTDENVRAETPYLRSLSSSCSQHCSPVVGSSPAANDAAAANPSPERQSQNPKAGNGATLAFGAEVAEIREALKARPLVRYNPAFDPVIREMLASGETVETIKRAILQACWLKLAGRDRAAGMGVADTSLIYSMRYFADVIPDVKGKTDSVYWRNLALRLPREERARLSQQRDVA